MLRLLAFLLLSSSAASAQALAPGPFDPPRIGERARVTWSETSVVTAVRAIRGARAETQVRETHLEATWTEEVAAVETRAGSLRPGEVVLRLERLARRDGGREDPPLAGRRIVLHPLLAGDARVAVDPGPPPSPAAVAFFARVADRLRESPYDDALRPERPTKVGDGWAPRRLAELVFDAPFVDVDEAASEGRCTLQALDPSPDVRLVARIRLLTVPGTRARVQEGGDYRLEVQAVAPPGRRPSRGRITEKATFEGRARGQLPDGTPFDLVTGARLESAIDVAPE